MTVPSTPRRAGPFYGNGSTTQFPFLFKVYARTDIQFVVAQPSGDAQTLVLDADYLVTLNADQDSAPGGVVTYPIAGSPLAIGGVAAIGGALDYTQPTDLPDGGAYRARSVETMGDRIVMLVQQVLEAQQRSFTFPLTEGVIPEFPPVSERANRLLGFDANGQFIGVLPEAGNATALAVDLGDKSVASKGPGAVGFNSQLSYPVGTAGIALNDIVRVKDFPYSAACDGVTDDTAVIQAAITWAAQAFDSDWFSAGVYSRPRIVKLGPRHKINGKLLVPRGVVIDMRGTTLEGTGFSGSDNVCFETAYFNGGILTTNIGTPAESHRVQYTQFLGGRFRNFKQAFNLYNFNEGCVVNGASFYNCRQAVKAERSFYAEFTNLMSRGGAGGATDPCYEFGFFVNVERIVGVTSVDRYLGFLFSGAINGQRLGIAAENGTHGAQFTGEVNPLLIGAGSYFESLTGIALDFGYAVAHRALMLEGIWFNGCATAIKVRQGTGGDIGRGCYFIACTVNIDTSDVDTTATVHLPPGGITSNAANLLPALPTGYSLNTKNRVVYPQTINSDVDGSAQARAVNLVDHYAELPWFGRSGRVSNKVLWCGFAVQLISGTDYRVVVTTRIAYDIDVGTFFSFTVNDNIGSYKICGNAAGPTVYASSLAGKTVLVDADGSGYLRITLSSFSHPTGVIGVTGQVRMQ